jgi:hypothetical protein
MQRPLTDVNPTINTTETEQEIIGANGNNEYSFLLTESIRNFL